MFHFDWSGLLVGPLAVNALENILEFIKNESLRSAAADLSRSHLEVKICGTHAIPTRHIEKISQLNIMYDKCTVQSGTVR